MARKLGFALLLSPNHRNIAGAKIFGGGTTGAVLGLENPAARRGANACGTRWTTACLKQPPPPFRHRFSFPLHGGLDPNQGFGGFLGWCPIYPLQGLADSLIQQAHPPLPSLRNTQASGPRGATAERGKCLPNPKMFDRSDSIDPDHLASGKEMELVVILRGPSPPPRHQKSSECPKRLAQDSRAEACERGSLWTGLSTEGPSPPFPRSPRAGPNEDGRGKPFGHECQLGSLWWTSNKVDLCPPTNVMGAPY